MIQVRTTPFGIRFIDDSSQVIFDKQCQLKNVAGGVRINDHLNQGVYTYDQFSAPTDFESNDDLFTFLSELSLDRGLTWKLHHSIGILEKEGIYTSIMGKSKALFKFGENKTISSSVYSTIQTFLSGEDQEVFLSDNLITHFASDNGDDTDIELVVEGHIIDELGRTTFVTQSVTVSGTTKTPLPTPLRDCTRAYNNNSDPLVGNIYFAENVTFTGGVPQGAGKTHMIIEAGDQQTKKLSTTISYNDVWFCAGIDFDVIEKAATTMSARISAREIGKTFRNLSAIGASDGSGKFFPFDPYFIVRPNSDVKLDAISSADNKHAAGSIQGYLGKVIAR